MSTMRKKIIDRLTSLNLLYYLFIVVLHNKHFCCPISHNEGCIAFFNKEIIKFSEVMIER